MSDGPRCSGVRTVPRSSPAGHRAHRDEAVQLQVDLAADLRRERIHDVVADERVVDGVAVVAAAEVRVTVVDLHVADAHRGDLEQHLQRREIDRRLVDLDVAVLHPGLVVVPGRQIAGQLRRGSRARAARAARRWPSSC